MRSLSSDAALQHGLNPSSNIIDELHAHKSAELYTALTTGTGAREQPFTLWISTAGVAGEGILAELFESMFSGTGELEDRGSLIIYRDRVNGTLIYWYGAPRRGVIARGHGGRRIRQGSKTEPAPPDVGGVGPSLILPGP